MDVSKVFLNYLIEVWKVCGEKENSMGKTYSKLMK
jgi:hypothetical protein